MTCAENPYMAAQRFIEQNDLPNYHLDTVADFITKNTGGAVQLNMAPTTYMDPFTGSSRYVPAAQPQQYQPQQQPLDPFTFPPVAATTPSLIPVAAPLTFKQANVLAIEKKLLEFNVTAAPANLATDEAALIGQLCKVLSSSTTSTIPPAAMHVLIKVCTSWQFERRFPGLDLLRLCALHAIRWPESQGTMVDLVLAACQRSEHAWATAASLDKVEETNCMLGLRALANLFSTKQGLQMVLAQQEQVYDTICTLWKKTVNKNIHLALVTLLLKHH
jgi:phospholipase A-2-activating protein